MLNFEDTLMLSEVFHTPKNTVFTVCKKALIELGFALEVSDFENMTITASSKTSFFSWGEDIQIILESSNTNSTEVKVVSTSKAQLIDWGKNADNEQAIMNKIKELSTHQ
ncbi:MAG: hypothetical protein KDD36_09590 [Flavobacteriales bacterium]|nr:hypothetical protein [Flavobacteriales bacterium]